MPQLIQPTYTTQKYDLPSTADSDDKAWVVLREGKLIGGESVWLASSGDKQEFTSRLLAQRIIEWNFTDQDGNPAEITPENVRCMEATDLAFLMIKISPSIRSTDIFDDDSKKKDSSDTSEPSLTA